MRRNVVVASLVTALVVALVAAGGVWWWRTATTTDLERALSLAPDDAARYTWTDWAGVRQELGTSDLATLLDEGFDADLTSASAMVRSAEALHDALGLSPATVTWELLAQSEEGAVVVMHVEDLDAVEGRLAGAGWDPPSVDGGVWSSDPGALSQLGVSPQFGQLRLDRSADVVLAGDSASFLSSTAATGNGELPEGVTDAAEAAGEPLSAVLLTGRQACAELAMAAAGPTDQEVAEQLVEDAGPVSPLSGFALAAQQDGSARAVLAFETEAQAQENADTRATLASGPAPGQGGSFTDRFTLSEVRADGRVVTMELAPTEGAYVVSDLSSGPVLFATC